MSRRMSQRTGPRRSQTDDWEQEADNWKYTAGYWKRRHRLQKKWLVGLAISSGVLLLLLLVVLTSSFISQPAPIRYAEQPVYTQFTEPGYVTPSHILACVKLKNGSTRGSGTVISKGIKYAAILSCAHCINGNIGNEVTFVNPDGSEFQAELLAFSRSLDVSLFRGPADKILGHSWVPHTFPQGVKNWEACGYTAAGGLKYKTVHPVHNSRRKGAINFYQVDTGAFAGGDSGGSVFADTGLIGVISASEPRSSDNKFNKQIYCGCTHTSLVAFLKAHESELAACGPWGCKPNQRDDNYRRRNPGWQPGPNIPIIIPPPDEPPAPIPPAEPGRPGADGKDGQPGPAGPIGPAGVDGAAGADGGDGGSGAKGRGIANATINQEGVLLIVLDDGTTIPAGVVRGPDGMPALLERLHGMDEVLAILINGFRYESVDVDGVVKFQQVKASGFPKSKPLRIRQTPVKVIGAE